MCPLVNALGVGAVRAVVGVAGARGKGGIAARRDVSGLVGCLNYLGHRRRARRGPVGDDEDKTSNDEG